jgi:hypothetical protein
MDFLAVSLLIKERTTTTNIKQKETDVSDVRKMIRKANPTTQPTYQIRQT